MQYEERKKYAEKLIQQDQYPAALIEFSALFKENPKDPQNIERFTFLFSRIQEGNNDFEPESAEQYVMRGISKFYNQELNKSIEDYDKALALDPRYDFALKSRAFSLKFLGQIEEAISDLKKAISIQPAGEYYDDLSEIYHLIGDLKTSLDFHEKAIEASPNDPRLWFNYGVHLIEDNNLKDALVKFNKAIELWPKYEDAIANRDLLLAHLEKNSV